MNCWMSALDFWVSLQKLCFRFFSKDLFTFYRITKFIQILKDKFLVVRWLILSVGLWSWSSGRSRAIKQSANRFYAYSPAIGPVCLPRPKFCLISTWRYSWLLISLGLDLIGDRIKFLRVQNFFCPARSRVLGLYHREVIVLFFSYR